VNTDLQFSVDVDLVYFLNVLAQHFSESRDVLAHCPLFHKVPKSLDAALKLARALRPSTLALSVVTTTLPTPPFTEALNYGTYQPALIDVQQDKVNSAGNS